jgi:hypothetical protein
MEGTASSVDGTICVREPGINLVVPYDSMTDKMHANS